MLRSDANMGLTPILSGLTNQLVFSLHPAFRQLTDGGTLACPPTIGFMLAGGKTGSPRKTP
ncbi:MAG: hypothetical protein ABIK27_01750 [Bacteroidota bacterium]